MHELHQRHPLRPLATLLLMRTRMSEPTIEQFMTRAPHTIGHQQTLAAAHRLMQACGIRHLPVREARRLTGIVSQRDLFMIEALGGIDPEQVKVSEAMTQDPFTVAPTAPVREVAAQMAEHKYGCAVVVDKDHVIGVFTTVDAMRALSELLEVLRPTR